MTAAERTARRLANAATLATAFAEGRFRKVTLREAWSLGWDAEAR
ncbi:hypothetical protein [Paracoccus versutus]